MSEPARRFPNLEDRNRLEKLGPSSGTIESLADRAKVLPKYAAIELKAMSFRGQARKIVTDDRGHYIWRMN